MKAKTFTASFSVGRKIKTRSKAFNDLTADMLFIYDYQFERGDFQICVLADHYKKLTGRTSIDIRIVKQVN
jgi:hypothetical protein